MHGETRDAQIVVPHGEHAHDGEHAADGGEFARGAEADGAVPFDAVSGGEDVVWVDDWGGVAVLPLAGLEGFCVGLPDEVDEVPVQGHFGFVHFREGMTEAGAKVVLVLGHFSFDCINW